MLFVVLLLIVALPLVWLGYRDGEEEAVAAASSRMRILASRAAERYRTQFGDALSTVAFGAIAQSLASAPPHDLGFKTAFLLDALVQSELLAGVFAGYGDGSVVQAVSLTGKNSWQRALGAPEGARFALRIITGKVTGERWREWRFVDAAGRTVGELAPTPARYDPRGKPWYKAALVASGPVLRGPYVLAMSGKMGFAIAERHRSNSQTVVGAYILLETARDFLRSESVSSNARSYMFDAKGRLLFHSDETAGEIELLEGGKRAEFRLRLAPSPDPLLVKARSLRGEGGRGSALRFSLDGVRYVGQVAAIPVPPLPDEQVLVIAAPLSDFTAASERRLMRGLLVSSALVLGGLLLILGASRFITRSLEAITAQARHLGDLDFNEEVRIQSRIKEISTLARAISTAREAIRTFALYVPRELVRKIVASGQFARRGALRQEVTVLFTDIQSFTTISERHSPEDVVAGLSAYFDLMSKGVEENGGSIVQFLGDSVYAMWNAPVVDPDHAAHGCQCALDLAGEVARFNAARRRAGLPEFVTRFGLHTGPAVVGSVGAENRLQYTAMGDTVNVASRLEGINKEFGTTILVSGAVEAGCRGRFMFRPLGLRHAKGREEEIAIFELMESGTRG